MYLNIRQDEKTYEKYTVEQYTWTDLHDQGDIYWYYLISLKLEILTFPIAAIFSVFVFLT